jgi:hypothetical protein
MSITPPPGSESTGGYCCPYIRSGRASTAASAQMEPPTSLLAASISSNQHPATNWPATYPSSVVSVDASSTEGSIALDTVRQNLRLAFEDALPAPAMMPHGHLPARRRRRHPAPSASHAHDLREQLLRYRVLREHPELATASPCHHSTQVADCPETHPTHSPPPTGEPDDSVSSITLDHHLMDTLEVVPVHVAATEQPSMFTACGSGTGKMAPSRTLSVLSTRPRGGVLKRSGSASLPPLQRYDRL